MMKPTDTGHLYNQIATWWNDQQNQLTAGMDFVRRAIGLCANQDTALDVGCGSGGRIITTLLNSGFEVTGIDISEAMLGYARKHHPTAHFLHADICKWLPPKRYDAIIAWDSVFQVPYLMQGQVIGKLCEALTSGGVILFTAGGIDGEINGPMGGQDFYYSSLSDLEYLKIMKAHGCKCILLERDQHPEEHVVFIGSKN